MNFLFGLFFVTLITGQLVRIPILLGAVVYPHDIALGLLVLMWLGTRTQKKQINKHKLLVPLSIFLGVALLSILVNVNSYTAWEVRVGSMYFFRYLYYSGLYFITKEYGKPKLLLLGLYGFGLALGFLGLVQYVLYPNLRNLSYLGWDPHLYRLFSTLLDPNFTGILLVLSFWVGMIFWEQKLIKRGLLITGQGVLILSLLLTFSRSSMLSFVISAVVYMFLQKKWALGGVVILLVSLFLFAGKFTGTSSSLFREDTTLARLTNWKQGIEIIKKQPILGYGFNMLRNVKTPTWYGQAQNSISHADSGMDNSFLFVLATTGIAGGIAWMYLWITGCVMGYRASRMKKTMYGTALFISIIAVVVHSMFINSMFYPWVMIWMWMLLGSVESKAK